MKFQMKLVPMMLIATVLPLAGLAGCSAEPASNSRPIAPADQDEHGQGSGSKASVAPVLDQKKADEGGSGRR